MIDLSLVRITRLVATAAKPQRWKAIHIAGTNGKGSVAAYLSTLFHHNGYRVGRFTSPHLIDRWDCISLNQKPVAEDVFLKAEREVKLRDAKSFSIIDHEEKNDHPPATEFEILTATAFDIFNDPKQDIQIGIIECGLGGRRDATNVLKSEDVLVSVMTKIGLDHQDFLGSTIEEIAKEKAGIIKENTPIVVDGSNNDNVRAVIRQEAELYNAPFINSTLSIFDLTKMNQTVLSLPNHQKENLALALHAFNVAQDQLQTNNEHNLTSHPRINIEEIISEVQDQHQGRLQWLSIDPLIPSNEPRPPKVLLDGAHNSQSATVLREYINQHLRKGNDKSRLIFILAFSSTKDLSSMLSSLLEGHENDIIIATSFGSVDGMPWVNCAEPGHIAEQARRLISSSHNDEDEKIYVIPDVKEAILKAVQLAVADSETRIDDGKVTDDTSHVKADGIVIAGSLYLVSDVLRLLRDAKGEASTTV